MSPTEQKEFIIKQRSAGVPDEQILATIQSASQPAPQRSGAGEILPTAFSIGGAIGGGFAGALGGPLGAFAGGVAGATAGGALGETIQQGIEKKYGQRADFNVGQVAAQGAISGGLQVLGAGIAKLGGTALKVARPNLVQFVSKLSGYADDVVERALQRTPGAVEGVSRGEPALVNIVNRMATKVSQLGASALEESRTVVSNLNKLSVLPNLPGTTQSVLKNSFNFVNKITNELRTKYNIGVRGGQLMFDRANLPSNIVSGTDKATIQSAFNSVATIRENVSIKHIQSVLERLLVLRSKTPSGSPTGPETKRIVGVMIDNIVDFVERVPAGFGRGYVEYAQFLKQNLPKRVLINEAKELFGVTSKISAKTVSQIEKRLLQMYNTGNLAVRELAEKVGGEVGEDVGGTVAGTLINTGDQISVRAPQLTTRGLVEKAAEFVPRSIVKSYISTGTLSGDMLNNPVLKYAAKVMGISVKALIQEIANLSANKTTR